MARSYTEVSVRQLGAIAANSDSDNARCTAIGMLLERGWGKPAQPITGADGDNLEVIIRHIVEQHTPAITVNPKRINGDNGDDDT